MATTVYVNTDNTGTKDGTTFATGYDNLQDAISAQVGANPDRTGDGPLTIYCGGTTADTVQVNVNGFTTTADDYIEIVPYTGYRHAGVWSESKYRLLVDDYAMYVQDDYVRISGIQIGMGTVTGERSTIYVTGQATGANRIDISGCLIRGSFSGTYRDVGIESDDADTALNCWNNVVYVNTLAGARGILVSGPTANVYHCTVVGGAYAIRIAAGTVVLKSSYFGGSSSDCISAGTAITQTYCATSDTTADGTGSIDSVAVNTSTFVNVTAGSQDFHLAAGTGSPLYNVGVAPGGSDPLNYTTDLDGDTVSLWCVGADSRAAASGQFARPSSDVADGNWLNEASSNTNLYASIDETSYSDSDYIRSGASPSNDTCTVGLSSISTPDTGTVTMRIRARFV